MATPQQLSFGALLKRNRRAAGLTQESLAERAGYSAIYVSKLERGERLPLPPTVELLASALELAPEERLALMATASRSATAQLHKTRLERRSGGPALPPLIGRDNELALIDRYFAGDCPPVLLFSGEPGIGKTRLLQEIGLRARASGWCVLMGGCHRRSGQEPYAPLAGAVATHLDSQTLTQQRQHLQGCAWLVRLLPELVDRQVLPAPSWTLPADQERRLLFAAISHYLVNIAGSAGTLLLLDDLQWAGTDLLDLLVSLVQTPGACPLRIAGAYRSTEVRPADPLSMLLADLVRDFSSVQADLRPLALSDAAVLLEALLADVEPRERNKVAERMLRCAAGIPYYLVSYVQALKAGGLTTTDGMSLETDVPGAISTSIRQRLALLPETAQQLVRVAAVVGGEIDCSLLLSIAVQHGWEKQEALIGLEAAIHARLLIDAEAFQMCTFAHELIREVIVSDLNSVRRADLHLQVAETLQQLPEHTQRRRVAELAWHFIEAGQGVRALPYVFQAGAQAEAVYAYAQAERHYRTAIELARHARDLEYEAEALEKLGDTSLVTGGSEAARKAFEAALVLLRSSPVTTASERSALQQGRLLRKIADTHNSERQFEEAAKAFQLAEAALGQAPGDQNTEWWHTWLRIQLHRLLLHYYQAQLPQMLELAERIQPLIDLYGTMRERSEFYQQLANISLRQHRYVATDEALAYAQTAFTMARELDDPDLLAERHSTLGFAYLWHGDLSRAHEHLLAALPLADHTRGTSSSELHIRCRTYLTVVQRKRGQIQETQSSAERCLATSQAQRLSTYTAMARANLAWVYWRQEQYDEAEMHGQAALDLWSQTKIVYPFHWAALWPLIGVGWARGHLAQIMPHLRALLGSEQQQLPADLSHLVEASIEDWDVGQCGAARSHLSAAITLAHTLGYL